MSLFIYLLSWLERAKRKLLEGCGSWPPPEAGCGIPNFSLKMRTRGEGKAFSTQNCTGHFVQDKKPPWQGIKGAVGYLLIPLGSWAFINIKLGMKVITVISFLYLRGPKAGLYIHQRDWEEPS